MLLYFSPLKKEYLSQKCLASSSLWHFFKIQLNNLLKFGASSRRGICFLELTIMWHTNFVLYPSIGYPSKFGDFVDMIGHSNTLLHYSSILPQIRYSWSGPIFNAYHKEFWQQTKNMISYPREKRQLKEVQEQLFSRPFGDSGVVSGGMMTAASSATANTTAVSFLQRHTPSSSFPFISRILLTLQN